MFVRVTTFDGEELHINPTQFAIFKWHPDNRKQKAGVGILSSGRELFFKPDSFKNILRTLNDSSSNETGVP